MLNMMKRLGDYFRHAVKTDEQKLNELEFISGSLEEAEELCDHKLEIISPEKLELSVYENTMGGEIIGWNKRVCDNGRVDELLLDPPIHGGLVGLIGVEKRGPLDTVQRSEHGITTWWTAHLMVYSGIPVRYASEE